MRCTRSLISFVLIAMVVALGILAFSTDQVKAQGCLITIEKSATPANDTPFDFQVTGGPPSFQLMDPSDPATLVLLEIEEIATVTELVPLGWTLNNIECTGLTGGSCGSTPCLFITEVPNGRTFECKDNGTVTCTFTNVLAPRTDVPTLSQWGLISMIILLGIITFGAFRRKRATA